MPNVPRYRIIVDCLGVRRGAVRGGDRYITGILSELAASENHDIFVVANQTWRDFVENLLPSTQYLVVPTTARFRLLRLLLQMILGPWIARRHRALIYVSTAVFPTVGFPCPTGVILHDLLLYHFPKEYSRLGWLLQSMLVRFSLPTLSAIFTSSQTSAEDIQTRFPKQTPKVHVIPSGAVPRLAPFGSPEHEQAILQEFALKDRKFVLSVLGSGQFKNPHGLAAAADKLLEKGRDDIDIVVAGDAVKVLKNIPHGPSLRPLGFVSDEVLAVLYAHAQAFVFPTFFEGFGIPVIEAQAAGLPVICSDIAVLREVSGEGALFVDPHSPDALARAIVSVVDSAEIQRNLTTLGKANAQRFTWASAAGKFLGACNSVAQETGILQRHAKVPPATARSNGGQSENPEI